MTTSPEDPTRETALDAVVMVYSLLEGHPASGCCVQLIQSRARLFTTALAILEARAILIRVYGVAPAAATAKLSQLAEGDMEIDGIDAAAMTAAMRLADEESMDVTDAVLLLAARDRQDAVIATDDRGLVRSCSRLGVDVVCPVDQQLRATMAKWESERLPTKGLPRILGQVHAWLAQRSGPFAEDFWSATGSGSRMP